MNLFRKKVLWDASYCFDGLSSERTLMHSLICCDAVVDVNWGVGGYGAVVWNHEGLEVVVEISLMKLILLKQKP